jgi:hypothetical protein
MRAGCREKEGMVIALEKNLTLIVLGSFRVFDLSI